MIFVNVGLLVHRMGLMFNVGLRGWMTISLSLLVNSMVHEERNIIYDNVKPKPSVLPLDTAQWTLVLAN